MQLRTLITLIIVLASIWQSPSAISPISGDSIPQIGKAKTQEELSQDNSDADNEEEDRVEAKV